MPDQAQFRDRKHDQRQMNEVTERFGKHQSILADVVRDVPASQKILKAQIEQVAATISSTVSEQLRLWRNRAEETTTTSASSASASSLSSLSLRSEKTATNRNRKVFADMSLRTLEDLRQTSTSHGRQCVSVRCEPCAVWGEVSGLAKYRVVLRNRDEEALSLLLEDAARITVLHMSDAYYMLLVLSNGAELLVRIAFHGVLAGTPCQSPVISTKALGASFTTPPCGIGTL
ncbi:hypothetical protein MRX96_046965 [Rhipicephalus microplus]